MESQLRRVLGSEFLERAFRIGSFAEQRQCRLYLVGGAVRDAVLLTPSVDIDFVVEGDAVKFVRELAQCWTTIFPTDPNPLKPVVFPKYGTAKLSFAQPLLPGLTHLDFASSRLEHYPVSGGAPVVVSGDIHSDLSRRDFSANALALAFGSSGELSIVDRFRGLEDIENRELRILHSDSFVDDPARLIRGLRFVTRLGFSFEEHTQRLFTAALEGEYLKRLPPLRFLDELRKSLEENDREAVLDVLMQQGVIAQLHPQLRWFGADSTKGWSEATNWKERFRALAADLSDEQLEAVLTGWGVKQSLESWLTK